MLVSSVNSVNNYNNLRVVSNSEASKANIPSQNIVTPSFKAHSQLTMHSIKNLQDVCCVYCGHKMLTNTQVEKISDKASKLKGLELARYLISLQPLMKPNEKKASCIIKEELKKHPEMDLKAVLEKRFPVHIDRLEKDQEKVLLELQKIAVDFSEHDKELTLNQVKRGLEGIKKREDGEHFKRNQYIDEFYSLNDKYEDFGNYLKIMTAIKSMPNTYTSIDAFFVKYSRKTSKEIMKRLLSPSQVSIEHLKPRSEGGTNILTNLVLACRKDNSARRSDPLETMPDLSKNLPVYFQTLRKSLAKKLPESELSKVEDYIQGVKDTIKGLMKKELHFSDPSKGKYY